MILAATRAAALAQLDAFVPRAGRAYAADRNRAGATSGLSPAIRRRLVSEAEVCARVVAAHGFVAAEKFIQEVCWRTYWVGWLQQRPAIWQRYCDDVERLEQQLGEDRALQRRFGAAVAGRTGIDAFDGWIADLRDTGWLHNHARMSFASIWIFTLGLPWQLGADLFYRQLLDACPASNTLSWRWVAGLQTVGKTYAARADLIRANSGGRYTVTAPLARTAPPLAPDIIPAPVAVPAAQRFDPDRRSGLFVTTADLSLETEVLPRLVAVAATTTIAGDPSDRKRAHAEAALADGLARAAAVASCAPERLDEAAPAGAIRDWAARHRLRQVVTPDAPVGPVADRLAVLAVALAADGVALVRVRRSWDEIAWPLATRGFFAFRAAIPKLLGAGSASP